MKKKRWFLEKYIIPVSYTHLNGNKETVWKLDDDIVLDAKEVLTVWVVNEAVEQAGLTVADFNNNYGTNFVTGDNFTTIHSLSLIHI